MLKTVNFLLQAILLLYVLFCQPVAAEETDDPFWLFPRGTKMEGVAQYALSPQDRDVTFIINDAPIGYKTKSADIEETQELLTDALAVAREHASDCPSDLIACLDALGAVYYRQRDYHNSRKYFEESLELRKSNYGADSLEVAEGNDFLALVLRVAGDCEKAVQLSTESVLIREKQLGANHADVGASYMRLACAYFDKLDTAMGMAMRDRAYSLCPSLSCENGRPVATAIFAPPINGMGKLVGLPVKLIDRENIDDAEKAAELKALPNALRTTKVSSLK